MDCNDSIRFTFSHYNYNIKLSLNYLSVQIKNKSLYTIIKEECQKLNIIIYENNIKLYDIENNIKINNYEDLINYNTKHCRIIIVPVIL